MQIDQKKLTKKQKYKLLLSEKISQKLSPDDRQTIHDLLLNDVNTEVAPKFEEWRKPYRYKIAYGGRGAGAKTWSATSLVVQMANVKKLCVGCFREIQKTLSESSHKTIANTIERLGYSNNWVITDEKIKHKTNGSYFFFRGLKDLRASMNVKGLEDISIAFIDEAASISFDSWVYLTPTIRNKGTEIWAIFNREEDRDPVYELYVLNPPENSCILELEPGSIDNPWWDQTELQAEWDWWKKYDPDEWEHMFLGQSRKQGMNAALTRTSIRAAMNRDIFDPKGAKVVGCDPADFGDDKTEIYIRKGLKIIDHKTIFKMDGVFVANEIAQMINHDPSIQINIDTTGIGTSARDHLRLLGLKVNPIHFAENAGDKDLYPEIITEMWFTLPIDEIDIPDDPELMRQLAGRRYTYDSNGRRKIESKKDYKKRFTKSPDKADALLLTYYQGKNMVIDNEIRKQLRKRRGL